MFDEAKADHAVNFINCLKHTKGRWREFRLNFSPGRMRSSVPILWDGKGKRIQAIQYLLL